MRSTGLLKRRTLVGKAEASERRDRTKGSDKLQMMIWPSGSGASGTMLDDEERGEGG